MATKASAVDEGFESLNRVSILTGEFLTAGFNFGSQMNNLRSLKSNHFRSSVPEQSFGTGIEDGDDAFQIGRNDRQLSGSLDDRLHSGTCQHRFFTSVSLFRFIRD